MVQSIIDKRRLESMILELILRHRSMNVKDIVDILRGTDIH
jgi:hypothetical protein